MSNTSGNTSGNIKLNNNPINEFSSSPIQSSNISNINNNASIKQNKKNIFANLKKKISFATDVFSTVTNADINDILYNILFFCFNIVILNGVSVKNMSNIKKEITNKKNKSYLLIKLLFKNFWYIPFILIFYWIITIIIIDVAFYFINYLLYSTTIKQIQQSGNYPKNIETQKKTSLSWKLTNNITRDIIIIFIMGIFNLIILFILTFIMIINKKDDEIDGVFIDNLFKIYYLSYMLCLSIIYFYINMHSDNISKFFNKKK